MYAFNAIWIQFPLPGERECSMIPVIDSNSWKCYFLNGYGESGRNFLTADWAERAGPQRGDNGLPDSCYSRESLRSLLGGQNSKLPRKH